MALCGTSSQPLPGMLERYPNIENVRLALDNDQAGQLATRRLAKVVWEKELYACACGMSFLALDTKGDLARNYGAIARDCYGYQVSVIDLRNPTRSDGFNFLTLANAYMDRFRGGASHRCDPPACGVFATHRDR